MTNKSEIILSTDVRARLLELDADERRQLTQGILDSLLASSPEEQSHIREFDKDYRATEIDGYLVTFRDLTKAEAKAYGASAGRYIVSIRPLWLLAERKRR